jgi:hypothetical protein
VPAQHLENDVFWAPACWALQEAARLLGIARETLRYKLRDLRLFVTRSFEAPEDSSSRNVRLARGAAAM